MRRLSIAIALLLGLSACTSDSPGSNPTASPSPDEPPLVTLLLQNIVLTDEPVVIGIDAASPSVAAIVTHSPQALVDIYLLPTPASPIPAAGCPGQPGARTDRSCVRDIGTGVRETLERRGPAGAVALSLRRGPGQANVRLEYGERTRAISLKLPRLAPPAGASVCKDNGCNPFIEMMPLRPGTLRASATFASGGVGRLQLQAGRVIAKSFSATGIPYRIPAEDVGRGTLRVESRLDTPAEYALALMNEDPAGPLEDIVLQATWP